MPQEPSVGRKAQHSLARKHRNTKSYEVVGTYALPSEERPEYDEVMATYGHGM